MGKHKALWATIRTDRDLDRFWRAAMEPLGFGSRRLWITMFGPTGEPTGLMLDVDDVPVALRDHEADAMLHAFGESLHRCVPGGSLALCYCRPGRDPMNLHDRRLALDITRAAARADVRLQPIYFANDTVIRVFAADDLLIEQH